MEIEANNPVKVLKFMLAEGYITPEEAELLDDLHFH